MTEQRLSREFLDLGSNARSVMDQVVVGMLKRVGLSFESKRLETYSAVFTLTSDMTAKDLEYAIPRLAASGIVAARVEGDGLRIRANLDVTVALAKSRMPGHVALIEKMERVQVIEVPDREETTMPPPLPPEPVKAVLPPPAPVKEVALPPRPKEVVKTLVSTPLPNLPPEAEKVSTPANLEGLKDRVKDAVLSMGKPFEHFYLPIEQGIEQDQGCVLKIFVIVDDERVRAFHQALGDRSVKFIPSFSSSRDKVGNLIRFPNPMV